MRAVLQRVTCARVAVEGREVGAIGRGIVALGDVGGAVLAVSQFTLLADCRKGRRPSFLSAAPPPEAKASYEQLVDLLRREGTTVGTGEFQAMMQVSLVNDGPVTILLDSRRS